MTVNTTGLRFEKILVKVEQGLHLALEQARLETDHGLTIGEQAEAAVRAVLRNYLPNGYSVGRGHVHDAYGERSRQTDVVIANPDHPLTYPEAEKSGTYVVDGVFAAGEVKAKLTLPKLDDSVKKGAKFKQLRMTINPGDHAITTADSARMSQTGLVPPYFALAFENKIATGTLLQRLEAADLVSPPEGKSWGSHDAGDAPQPPLDIVCILGEGVAMYHRPDNPLNMGITEGVPPDNRRMDFHADRRAAGLDLDLAARCDASNPAQWLGAQPVPDAESEEPQVHDRTRLYHSSAAEFSSK
jgi:hypothetical protein